MSLFLLLPPPPAPQHALLAGSLAYACITVPLLSPYKAQRELLEAGPSHRVPKAGHSEEQAASPHLGERVTGGMDGWPAHA